MKWKITYGMCDGTGPYTDEAEGDCMMDVLVTFCTDHNRHNLISCVPSGTVDVRPGATFDEWWEAKGEAGKFKMIAQNIIQWIEDTR